MSQPLLTKLALLLLVNEQPTKTTQDVPRTHVRQRRLEALTAWIDGHLDQPIDLTLLEKQAGCSKRTLQYHFRCSFGCTPMQWVRWRRLQTAMERLRSSTERPNLREIARSVGYLNQSAFCRDFKRLHGLRPSEVVRSAANSSDNSQTMRSQKVARLS